MNYVVCLYNRTLCCSWKSFHKILVMNAKYLHYIIIISAKKKNQFAKCLPVHHNIPDFNHSRGQQKATDVQQLQTPHEKLIEPSHFSWFSLDIWWSPASFLIFVHTIHLLPPADLPSRQAPRRQLPTWRCVYLQFSTDFSRLGVAGGGLLEYWGSC